MPIEKVIVLEDDQIVRKNLENCLRRRRYDVASVSTIAAAQECLAKDNFDVIFLDVRLPDGDACKARKPFSICLPEAGSGLIGDKPLFAAQRDAIARQIQEMGTQLFQAF